MAFGGISLLDVTVNGAGAGDLATASLVLSTRFIEFDAAVWSNNTVRVMARNISEATFDLAAATVAVPFYLQWDKPFGVGQGTGTPVDDRDHQVRFALTGRLRRVGPYT